MKLVCPLTHLAVTMGGTELLARLNAATQRGDLRTLAGKRYPLPLEGVLVRADGAVGYPVLHGIPNMLPDAGLDISPYVQVGDLAADS